MADFEARDSGTILHSVFEYLYLKYLTREEMRQLKDASDLETMKYLKKICYKILDFVLEERNEIWGKEQFFPVIDNFCWQEVNRLFDITDLVGYRAAVDEYFFPLKTEAKYQSSGTFVIEEDGTWISSFDDSDTYRFRCIIDAVMLYPGSYLREGHDCKVIRDYKTGKNKADYYRHKLGAASGDKYQCVYQSVFVPEMRDVTHVEVFYPREHPGREDRDNPGKYLPIRGWEEGLDKTKPWGCITEPAKITPRMEATSKRHMDKYWEMLETGRFKINTNIWFCEEYCDYYGTCFKFRDSEEFIRSGRGHK